MKRIIIPLFLSFFAVNAFAATTKAASGKTPETSTFTAVGVSNAKTASVKSGNTAKQILDKALDIAVPPYNENKVSSAYIVDAVQFFKGAKKRTVTTVDGEYFRQDVETIVQENVMTYTSISIPEKGVYISVNGSPYTFEPSRNDKSNGEFEDVFKTVREDDDKYIIAFAKENASDSKNYVIDMELKEEYAKKAGKKNKDAERILSGLSMFKFKFYIDKKTNLVTQAEVIGSKENIGKIVFKYSDYKKIPGTRFYYPYTFETINAFGNRDEEQVSVITKTQSFKVVKSKDIASKFIISEEETKDEDKESKKDDNNFGKEIGKEVENAAKDETKDQIKRGVKKGVSGVFKGIF